MKLIPPVWKPYILSDLSSSLVISKEDLGWRKLIKNWRRIYLSIFFLFEHKFLFGYHTAIPSRTNKLCQQQKPSSPPNKAKQIGSKSIRQLNYCFVPSSWRTLLIHKYQHIMLPADSLENLWAANDSFVPREGNVWGNFCHQAPLRPVKRGMSRNITTAVLDSSLNSPVRTN